MPDGAAPVVLDTPPSPASPAAPPAASASAAARPVRSTIDRLRDGPRDNPLVAWSVTIGLAALAFVIRLVDLARPATLVFDETYYAKDAYSLLKFGYERGWPDWANDSIVAGQPDVYNSDAAFIVHPQVGKWLIALGEHVFGMTSFGWRFPALVAGSLMIAVVVRLARRLSRSLLVGAMAGILLTFDGLHFVMSRIALLDIFQSLFIVSAVMCVVADRDRFRHRLADHLTRQGLTTLGGQAGPWVFRPWLIASGVLWGLAIGTKWNSAYALAVSGVLVVAWSVTARRLAGARHRSWLALLADGVPAFLSLVVLAGFVYVATWASWLATSGGYDRQWGAGHPDAPTVRLLGPALASLLQYHQDIYAFHTGDYIKQSNHPYAAHPAGWLVLARPIGIDAVNDIQPGAEGCAGPETCLRVITANGTPVLWWAAAIALVVSLVWWVAGRDWRFGTPAALALSTYLPWFAYTERSLFFFYAITIVPFTAICLALCLGQILGPPGDPVTGAGLARRRQGAMVVGVLMGLVVFNFAFLYPVLTDALLTRTQWLLRMWFGSWI